MAAISHVPFCMQSAHIKTHTLMHTHRTQRKTEVKRNKIYFTQYFIYNPINSIKNQSKLIIFRKWFCSKIGWLLPPSPSPISPVILHYAHKTAQSSLYIVCAVILYFSPRQHLLLLFLMFASMPNVSIHKSERKDKSDSGNGYREVRETKKESSMASSPPSHKCLKFGKTGWFAFTRALCHFPFLFSQTLLWKCNV